MTDEEARKLAEAHWEWLESLLHKLYVDAMIHGFGHGVEWQKIKALAPEVKE